MLLVIVVIMILKEHEKIHLTNCLPFENTMQHEGSEAHRIINIKRMNKLILFYFHLFIKSSEQRAALHTGPEWRRLVCKN